MSTRETVREHRARTWAELTWWVHPARVMAPWALGAAVVVIVVRWLAGAEVGTPPATRPGWLHWPDLSWPPAWVLALVVLVAAGWLGAAVAGRVRRGYPLGRSWMRPFR